LPRTLRATVQGNLKTGAQMTVERPAEPPVEPLSNPVCAPPLYPRQAPQPARLFGWRLPDRGTLVAKKETDNQPPDWVHARTRPPGAAGVGSATPYASAARSPRKRQRVSGLLWPFLAHPNRSLVLATIEPDLTWLRMWRVRVPDGYPAAIVDLSRAKDVAASVVPSILNKQGEAAA
jgi:hypothetical protein